MPTTKDLTMEIMPAKIEAETKYFQSTSSRILAAPIAPSAVWPIVHSARCAAAIQNSLFFITFPPFKICILYVFCPYNLRINVGLSDKINISDIINDLTSTATNKPLSANQGKVLDGKISNLPVKANDKHFYNANGLEVVNANATAYTDLTCRNVSVSGSYIKTGASAINVTNNAGNAWLPLNASDLKINGSKSVYDSLPKTYTFSNISLTGDGIGYLDYNVLRPSTHIVTSAFGTVASPGGLCRFEVLADMTNDVYAIQPWTYKDVKVTSTTANVTIGYFKR